MRITNKLNLPIPFIRYASESNYEYKENRYSVTELLLPVREILLNRKYANHIEKDVADYIPALFGTAVHSILEDKTPVLTGATPEVPIEYSIGGDTIAGRIDLLDLENFEIIDYKNCSVSKVVREDFEDWKLQNMMYSWIILMVKGIVIRDLKDYALMKDWSKLKAANSSNYPQSPVYVFKYHMEDSDFDYIEKYIRMKLDLINRCKETFTLPKCTDEEKWYTGTKYAVYKKAGDKKAVIVCDTEEEAHGYITNKCEGAGEIEVRKGEYLKCKYYCDCAKFCGKEG